MDDEQQGYPPASLVADRVGFVGVSRAQRVLQTSVPLPCRWSEPSVVVAVSGLAQLAEI